MARKYLKKAELTSASGSEDVRDTVQAILDDIENRGDEGAMEYAAKFDKYDGNIKLTAAEIEAASALVPEKLKKDIQFAHDNVRRFAEAQMATMQDIETEVVPGLIAGQKSIPVRTAGCYIPGGRYSHIASAIMTVTTASVAGCNNIIACSPPRPGVGIAPAIVYAAHICGADTILALGGVQGVAAMAFGLFELPKADILVGPGNQFVAEAKRILFGRVGIDMFAGPTDSPISTVKMQKPHGAIMQKLSSVTTAKKWRLHQMTMHRNISPYRRKTSIGGWAAYNATALCSLVKKQQLHLATRHPAPTTSCQRRALQNTPAVCQFINT